MVTVREATEEDIPRLLVLYSQLALTPGERPFTDAHSEPGFRAFRNMTSVPGYHLLVAEDDGEIAGTLVLVILPGLAHGISHWAVIEYVVVDEALRGRGIGEQLMERAADLARAARCYKIMLGSNKQRADAHRFYRRIGYKATHEGFTQYFHYD